MSCVFCVMLYPYMLCVTLLMDLFVWCVSCLTGFVICLVKRFAICLGVVAILLLNVMELFGVGRGGGAMFSKTSACRTNHEGHQQREEVLGLV